MTDQEFVKLHYHNARLLVEDGLAQIFNGEELLGCSWSESEAWNRAKSHIESPNEEKATLRLQVLTSRLDELVKRVGALEHGPSQPAANQKKSNSPIIKLTYYVGDEDRIIEMRSATNNRMAICTGDGTIFITREQAKAFFGFKD